MSAQLKQHAATKPILCESRGTSTRDTYDDLELQCQESTHQLDRRQSRTRAKPLSTPEAVADEQRQRQKYRRKKERKRKNKLKKFLQHYESSDKLKIILNRIYEGRASFADVERDLPAVVNSIQDQEVFFEILNESITNYIEDLAEGIWDHLNQFTGPYELEDFIQQYDHFEDSPQFFTLIIEELCYTHAEIQTSSGQVEKVIDMYVSSFCPKVQLDDQQYNLSRNTLNHLINCNTFLTFVVEQLQGFFGEHGEKLEGSQVEYQVQLRDLLQNVQLKKSEGDRDDWEDDGLHIDSENSTEQEFGGSATEQPVAPEQVSSAKKAKRRRNKKKNQANQSKEFQTSTVQPVTEEDFDRLVTYGLSLLTLPKQRLACQFEQGWLDQLAASLIPPKHD